jgi:hypothetical protein
MIDWLAHLGFNVFFGGIGLLAVLFIGGFLLMIVLSPLATVGEQLGKWDKEQRKKAAAAAAVAKAAANAKITAAQSPGVYRATAAYRLGRWFRRVRQ